MAKKKSRKGGQIGVPKSTIPVVRTPSDRVRKTSGNKPGTRNSVVEAAENARQNAKKDPRIGSKVPVDLMRHKKATTQSTEKKVTYKTPKHELDAIEADEKLQQLLDKQESKKLTKVEQEYVDIKLARHLVLCDMLGINASEEIEEEDDPLSGLDAISIDDYKD
ncbi:MAG: ribosome assembly protein YihI (activator of Der GTPase) [Glaciecola sp.]|jgi:ribosome assembly protein YihI (activator of Der GTPase)|mmetsp:Transcript_60427/g.191924  ORF Transcript_60427/g.191924 Transcript_60427/m.191924 type:complete len:164 (-) Transcript_60427:570-1061(-)